LQDLTINGSVDKFLQSEGGKTVKVVAVTLVLLSKRKKQDGAF
jgi:hypothetical protein